MSRLIKTVLLLATAAGAQMLAAPPAAAQAGTARVSVSKVTPEYISVSDGSVYGSMWGTISGTAQSVNVFYRNPQGGGGKISPGRVNGPFGFPVQTSLNEVVQGGVVTVFASPSENGTHLPGPITRVPVSITLPEPVIVAATGGRYSASIIGTAMRGARVDVTVAGQTKRVVANGHTGDWSVPFANVPAGNHQATAQVIDIKRAFPNSTIARKQVTSEADVIRPLVVTRPTANATVKQRLQVVGVASRNRGNVLVQLGGGPIVEASVWGNDVWSASVISPIDVDGQVPLVVTMPGTGERVTRMVNVEPFSGPVVSRFELRRDLNAREANYLIEGTATADSEVWYYFRLGNGMGSGQQGWKKLADVADDGRWRYDGPMIRDLAFDTVMVDGKPVSQGGVFTTPSHGEYYYDAVRTLMVEGAPELTSSTKVGRYTTLRGVATSGRLQPIKVTLPDGSSVLAQVGADRTWSVDVGPLAPGRAVIGLATDVPANQAYRFATSQVVLDVLDGL